MHMGSPQSFSSSITMNDSDVSEDSDFAEINLNPPKSPKIFQNKAPTPAVKRDSVFYSETVTIQVRFNFILLLAFHNMQLYRSRIHSSVFSKVALKYKEPPLKPYFPFHKLREKLSRGMMIRAPFICTESVK